jgi:hypothetical protein
MVACVVQPCKIFIVRHSPIGKIAGNRGSLAVDRGPFENERSPPARGFIPGFRKMEGGGSSRSVEKRIEDRASPRDRPEEGCPTGGHDRSARILICRTASRVPGCTRRISPSPSACIEPDATGSPSPSSILKRSTTYYQRTSHRDDRMQSSAARKSLFTTPPAAPTTTPEG